jgi:hypothetical protein
VEPPEIRHWENITEIDENEHAIGVDIEKGWIIVPVVRKDW